ncbi:Oidioi.mRNA.OKI2018_I69.XSR.g14296.t1.cds [Oikopleura dioica]|uniref:Oidioi.mRNA.OKI2018_I69.XSR.g14296.t1.cds n=1 Tax=Oikopleura dioica TaxID=34765 RepID=A0ABN7S9C9_OIKDI|nr:Oidioi.mRNA.OKI2018_I69.XSR.g14296.t1.cds [Oikopleura dioica]
MGIYNFDTYENPCEYTWVLQTRNVCGAMQIFVNMILVIVFANEKNLSCHEGLIVQPVIQGLLGFLTMGSATTGASVTMVVISGLLNLVAIFVNWLFFYLYTKIQRKAEKEVPLGRKYLFGTILMTLMAGTSAIIGLAFQTKCHKI